MSDRDLSEPGDVDAWLGRPASPPATPDLDAARRRLRRRNAILDWSQIGFLVLVPLLSIITIAIAHHADKRASGARSDTHALTGDVSSLTGSVDRLTTNQEDTARLEAQVAALAEAFRRIVTATTPEERREAIDALNALGPPPATSDAPPSSSPSTAPRPPPSSATTTTAPAPAPPPASSTTTTTSTTTRRPVLPGLTVPTIPLGPTRRSSSSSPAWPSPSWPYWPALAALAFLLAVPVALTAGRTTERKPMTQPSTDPAVKAAPNPAARIIRTLYMVVVAVAVAIPAATAAFGFTAETSAKLIGLAGGITILVTAIWNALEGAGVIGTVHAGAVPVTRLAVDDVDLIAAAVHATAPEPPAGDLAVDAFAVELSDEEVEKIANAVARHVAIASPASAAKKAAPRKSSARTHGTRAR